MDAKARKQLLARLSSELASLLGDQLDRVLLYGSYARGNPGPESDLDILIVLRGDFDYAVMLRQTSELIAKLSLQNDVVISRAFISKQRYETERSPFAVNVRRDGIAI